MKINKGEDANAFPMVNELGEVYDTGMSLRDYFASSISDNFDDLHRDAQYALMGWSPSEASSDYVSGSYGTKYLEWLAKGRAKWKFMQADAILKARLK